MPTPNVVNIIKGTNLADTLLGLNGDDMISGELGDDIIRGGGGKDLLLGNDGNDYIDGGTGADILFGGRGVDTLIGGAGGDLLSGDSESDTLRGGTGADTFQFIARTASTGADTILDFSVSDGDTLLFSKYAPGATLVVVQNGANVDVFVDLDGGVSRSIAPTYDYLAATVLNANAADVQAASHFDFELMP